MDSSRRALIEKLVSNAQEKVFSLRELVPIIPEERQRVLEEDIAQVPDEHHELQLIEDACKGFEQKWAEAPSVRVEASQMGTEDRRGLQEWPADVVSEYGGAEQKTFCDLERIPESRRLVDDASARAPSDNIIDSEGEVAVTSS